MKKTIIILLLLLVGIQFIPTAQENPSSDLALALTPPPEVEQILKKACMDCHSNNTQWPIYSNISPASLLIASHVKDGRQSINFSEYAKIDNQTKIKRLDRATRLVKIGFMPPMSYTLIHSEAKLSVDEKKILIDYFKKLHEEELSKIS